MRARGGRPGVKLPGAVRLFGQAGPINRSLPPASRLRDAPVARDLRPARLYPASPPAGCPGACAHALGSPRLPGARVATSGLVRAGAESARGAATTYRNPCRFVV